MHVSDQGLPSYIRMYTAFFYILVSLISLEMNSENGDLFQRTIALTLTLSIDCMTCMR
jgi:hypothetical protein